MSTRAVLLDIEGTVTPISFVHEVLFPYARTHLPAFLERNGERQDVRGVIDELQREHAGDVLSYVFRLMEEDRKAAALKTLQGFVWQEGYRSGELVTEVFPDVPGAMERWHSNSRVAIFSSGSVLAQKMLFSHTANGDLSNSVSGWFDTAVGPKKECESYLRIAEALGLPPSEVLFISDVVAELDAAREAGMASRLAMRPGNAPQPPTDHVRITTFDGLAV